MLSVGVLYVLSVTTALVLLLFWGDLEGEVGVTDGRRLFFTHTKRIWYEIMMHMGRMRVFMARIVGSNVLCFKRNAQFAPHFSTGGAWTPHTPQPRSTTTLLSTHNQAKNRQSHTGAVSCTASMTPIPSLASQPSTIKIAIHDIPGTVSEELGDLLLAQGASSVAVEEFLPPGGKEEKLYAHDSSSNNKVWKRCTVLGYFNITNPDDDADIDRGETSTNTVGVDAQYTAIARDCVDALLPGLGQEGTRSYSITSTYIAPRDWEEAIKDSYQPVEISPGLWIIPSWSNTKDDISTTTTGSSTERINIILEPGLAFGTGDHPTTRLCLRWLHRLSTNSKDGGSSSSSNNTKPIKKILDYGTGSGVLAVAALLIFPLATAIGTDIEPLSIKSARQNAALNGVGGDRFRALLVDADLSSSPSSNSRTAAEQKEEEDAMGQHKGSCDIVIANILQGPLLDLASLLASYSAPGSWLALSGILKDRQAEEVIERYSEWYDGFEVEEENGWALVTARRRHP